MMIFSFFLSLSLSPLVIENLQIHFISKYLISHFGKISPAKKRFLSSMHLKRALHSGQAYGEG
jgi:hypothetical protein